MTEPTTYSSLHHAVAFLERRACMEWMEQYGLGDDLELALAEHGKRITVCYERRQGSSVSVTVSIECQRPTLNQQSYFVLQRAGNRQYVDAEQASPLR
jgi:hypothetical protein